MGPLARHRAARCTRCPTSRYQWATCCSRNRSPDAPAIHEARSTHQQPASRCMPRALLSVSDKSGLVDFARGLRTLDWEIISTGGTAKTLRDANIPVRDVAEVTRFPEMLDGRVKTLHPVVHGGLLARRDVEEHMTALAEQGIDTIDLVAVNLYPFRETASRPNVHPDAVIEQIDIGGPSMLRSAAKNFSSVFAVVDPEDYPRVLAALQAQDDDVDLRRILAAKVFAHTGAYDA